MWAASYRDVADVPALQEPMRRVRSYLDSLRDDLVRHLAPALKSSDSARATLGCAVQFFTWQSLAGQWLDDLAMANLVCGWLQGTTQSSSLTNGALQ